MCAWFCAPRWLSFVTGYQYLDRWARNRTELVELCTRSRFDALITLSWYEQAPPQAADGRGMHALPPLHL